MTGHLSRFAILLSLLGLIALPTAQVVGAQTLPQVTVVATDAVAGEPGTNTGTFTVFRTGDTTATLTVSYAVGGTATSGIDYTALTGSVIIPIGASMAKVTLTALDDLLIERAETVTVMLLPSSAYLIGALNVATVKIRDNDEIASDDHEGKFEDGRPGWGWGDKNHEHFGPPGKDSEAFAAWHGRGHGHGNAKGHHDD